MQKGSGGAMAMEAIKITLQDCLACSGCVTTAEEILVAAQSKNEIVKALSLSTSSSGSSSGDQEAGASRPRLVSISPPSAAAIAAHFGIQMAEAYSMIAGFFRAVLTPSPSSLVTENEEEKPPPPATTVEPPLPAVYIVDLKGAEELSAVLVAAEYHHRCKEAPETLPMIVSACPGWVCYCEKQGAALLPHLCPILSAQGILGSYAKRCISSDLYHISVQPCFDRKLEAARDAATVSRGSTSSSAVTVEMEEVYYTDCVLSTAELVEWMLSVDPSLPWRSSLDGEEEDQLSSAEAVQGDTPAASSPTASDAAAEAARLAGSGGYHQRAIAYRVAKEGAVPASSSPAVAYAVKRNLNHQLATCAALPNEVFCVAYGFQQIQNIARGLRKKNPAMRGYTFIELMACPDGCLNGGGQLRLPGRSHVEVLRAVLEAFAQSREASSQHWDDVGGRRQASLNDTLADEEALSHLAPAQRRRIETASPLPRVPSTAASGTPARPFHPRTMRAAMPALGDAAWRCIFRDRQKEYEAMLDAGHVQSLKW